MLTVNSVDNKFFIKCMYTNIDRISNERVEFSLRVDKVKPHIIFITETSFVLPTLPLISLKLTIIVLFVKKETYWLMFMVVA